MRIITKATSALPIAVSALVICRSFMASIRMIGEPMAAISEIEAGEGATTTTTEGSSYRPPLLDQQDTCPSSGPKVGKECSQ